MNGEKIVVTCRNRGGMMNVDVRDKFPSNEELNKIMDTYDYVRVTVIEAGQRESFDYEKEVN